ncbi:MAG: hypothetical protein ACRDWB_06345, partial [Acidimicrobiales bacterium]
MVTLMAACATALSLVGVSLEATVPAQAAAPAPLPRFQNGDGISVVSQTNNGREIDLQVTTTAVSGQHEVIVLLPEGYTANTTTHYPVLFLLNGALAGPSQWIDSGGAAAQ